MKKLARLADKGGHWSLAVIGQWGSLVIGHWSLGLSVFFAASFSTAIIFAQPADSTYILIKTIEVKAKDFTTDKLQQIYVVTPDNEVIKYDTEGNETFRYNNKTLGELAHIDVTNPFSIMLYYPEFMNIITLDRTLNLTGQFNLYDLNLLYVKGVGMSNDNNIWVYDDALFKLKKIDHEGHTIVESDNLSLLLGHSISPNFILEKEQTVYVNDPQLGIFLFDVFAEYIKTLDFKGLTDFQVYADQLIYFQDGKLQFFHLKSLLTRPLKLPPSISATDKIRVQKNKLFVLKPKGVEVYAF